MPYPLPSPLSSHTLTVTTATLAWHSTRSHPSSWLENFTLCSGKTTQTQTDLRRFWIGSRTSSTSVLDTRALSFSLFCDVAKNITETQVWFVTLVLFNDKLINLVNQTVSMLTLAFSSNHMLSYKYSRRELLAWSQTLRLVLRLLGLRFG